LADRSKAAVAGVIAHLCADYPDYMIGKIGGPAPGTWLKPRWAATG